MQRGLKMLLACLAVSASCVQVPPQHRSLGLRNPTGSDWYARGGRAAVGGSPGFGSLRGGDGGARDGGIMTGWSNPFLACFLVGSMPRIIWPIIRRPSLTTASSKSDVLGRVLLLQACVLSPRGKWGDDGDSGRQEHLTEMLW